MNWGQLSTVIWLRWRLTRNQFSRGGKLNAVISVIGMVGGILAAVLMAIAGVVGGATALAQESPMLTMLSWDGIVAIFLFIWMIGVLVEIQRSESIDLARLLHLPVSLNGIFVMNYIASLLTMSIILFLPMIVGLCLGWAWASGAVKLLLIPLALSFIFMVSAWSYCLRGWLVTLMINPRRRRNVVAIATLTFVLLSQVPQIYVNFFLKKNIKAARQQARERRNARPNNSDTAADSPMHKGADWEDEIPRALIVAQTYVPIFWLPKGAMELVDGDPWPALLGTLGGCLLGAVGLARAYRSTIRFYMGQDTAKALKIAAPAALRAGPPRVAFMERSLPFLAEDTAALALAFFRSLTRAPEVKMSLFANFFILVAVVPLMLSRQARGVTEVGQLFYLTGAVCFTFFGLWQMMFNVFGYDREGFRSLVLSPASRRSVLLAKNLSIAPVAAGLGAAMLTAVKLSLHVPALEVLAGLIKLVAIFLLLSVVGNLVSIWVPYRVTAGSLKPTKPPAKTVLLIFVTQLLFPVVMGPLFLVPLLGMLSQNFGWWPAMVIDGLASILLLAIAVLIYWLTLNGLSEMLERREQNVLLVVSREGE